MTWKNIGFRQDRRSAPRHVLYVTAAFHMADVQACVAPRARALSRDVRSRSREAGSVLQNLKLLRHRHETHRERNLIKFQRTILFAQVSTLRESSSIPKISIFFTVFRLISRKL